MYLIQCITSMYEENVSFDKHDVNFSTMPTQHYKLGDYFLRLHKYLLKEWIAENKLFKCPAGTGYIFHGMSIMCEYHRGVEVVGSHVPPSPYRAQAGHSNAPELLAYLWPSLLHSFHQDWSRNDGAGRTQGCVCHTQGPLPYLSCSVNT